MFFIYFLTSSALSLFSVAVDVSASNTFYFTDWATICALLFTLITLSILGSWGLKSLELTSLVRLFAHLASANFPETADAESAN